jgi:hypothetical protein
MATRAYTSVISESTSVPKYSMNASSSKTRSIYSVAGIINIARNFLIPYPRDARVLQPFHIKVEPVEDGFVAISSISDVYELGETLTQAASNCLYSLVDELIWFQDHQESLSPSMLRDFDRLQFHLLRFCY